MKKIAIFLGNDVLSHMTFCNFLPSLMAMGIKPTIYYPTIRFSQRTQQPQLINYSFYERRLFLDGVLPFIDALDTPNRQAAYQTPKQLTKTYDIFFEPIENINDLPTIKKILIDQGHIGILSIRCLQIFHTNTLHFIKQHGFIWNMHPGLLPAYRGVLPNIRALQNNDPVTGWTLHEIEPGIDTGNILGFKRIPLSRDIAMFDLSDMLAKPGADLFISALKKQIDGNEVLGLYRQHKNEGKYFSYPTQEELRTLKSQGIRLIPRLKNIVDFYTERFCPGNEAFRRHLIQAIAEHESFMRLTYPEEYDGITDFGAITKAA